ncbi:SGNH/GDSL hydrolase family protein [Methylobacterium longum]|uniref:SGNH/GDSL hydrolase family protein n=1 Tax=Methylobacterium longum TaxID=767694 RepID=A0ABT8AXW3_9HYPH|nr:SGNH/GDSL hydrolase family protein [Methylobacterium longum]MDN3574331.1 SGNH/GDSL hydrolase family protein [Methylobacterium longum]GJE15209.1 hypothetical protein FOHLNKBM_6287 [Methylobacterium longum]
MSLADNEAVLREKFLHHVKFFDSASRYPAPYIGFAGRPHHQFQIHCIPYDAAGFLNPETTGPRTCPEEIRIFVVGDSTMATGTELENTVPKRIERIFQERLSEKVKVYNFAVVSSNTEQMCALIWSRLLDLDPDLIVVVSGGTDAFQPYSFDPRPGFPYNFFINEYLYAHYFDENNDKSWRSGLDYDAVVTGAFDLCTKLRKNVNYGSHEWETSVINSYTGSLIKLIRIAKAVPIPIFYFLEPIVVRKETSDVNQPRFASPDTIHYLVRQYDRFADSLSSLRLLGLPKNLRLIDASRALNETGTGEFYDILHYDRDGTETVAKFLADHLFDCVQKLSAHTSERSIIGRIRKTVNYFMR